jgi:ribosomal protein L11 methyltransferase
MRTGLASGFRSPLLRDAAPFDLVLANILARPLRGLAADMARMTRPGGRAVLSGILSPQAAGVEAVYRALGFRRERRIRLAPWTTLILRRG